MDRVQKILQYECLHRSGYKGDGIGIALVDTGVSYHQDLASRVVAFKDFVNGRNEAYDDNGHGTHIAGILAGNGAMSEGKYVGIAPEANLYVCKCLDHKGNGFFDSAIKAFQSIRSDKSQYNIRLINVSIGGELIENDNRQSYFLEEVRKLWQEGYIVVAAAGNGGPKRHTITVPGCVKEIITVGSIFENQGNPYSGNGPTKNCIVKPEVVAPGTGIISCSNKGASYSPLSGTSMAAPIVTGSIALLLQKYPYLSNKEVKKLLLFTCRDLGIETNRQGWGMINPIGLLMCSPQLACRHKITNSLIEILENYSNQKRIG